MKYPSIFLFGIFKWIVPQVVFFIDYASTQRNILES